MRKVLLVSLDAFFEPDIDHLPPDGAIARVLREGSWCRKVVTTFPALTYPIHVTMVTGCDPADTGVGQNQPFQPDVPEKNRRWYWERKHIRVPTLFEAVREAGGKSCSILWPVNCKNRAVSWCFPEVHPLPGENAVLKALRFGTPLYILAGEKRFGRLRKGIEEPWLSDYAASLAGDTVRRYKPDLTALHFPRKRMKRSGGWTGASVNCGKNSAAHLAWKMPCWSLSAITDRPISAGPSTCGKP